MKRSLYLKDNKRFVADQFHKYNELLANDDGKTTLSIANQIDVAYGYILNKTFQGVAVEKFSCDVQSMDFDNEKQAAQIINKFVENKTHDKIKNFIQPENIDSDTAIMLINAIYFKSNWKHKFNKTLTAPDDFYVNENETVQVDFMNIQSNFRSEYIYELQASALEMKYANPKYSFFILLPQSRSGLSTLETKLKNFDLTKIIDSFWLGELGVDVKIPKFKAEQEINLNEILKKV